MSIFDRFIAWLNSYPPAMRVLIVALVPAIIVFSIEEMTRPAPAPAPAVQEEPPVRHNFTASDLDKVSKITATSQQLLGGMDEAIRGLASNSSEAICLGGLRNGVYAYISTSLMRMQQDVATSLHMQSEDDEQYIDHIIVNGATASLNAMPAMNNTVSSMVIACPGNAVVTIKSKEIGTFLTQSTAMLRAVQATAARK